MAVRVEMTDRRGISKEAEKTSGTIDRWGILREIWWGMMSISHQY